MIQKNGEKKNHWSYSKKDKDVFISGYTSKVDGRKMDLHASNVYNWQKYCRMHLVKRNHNMFRAPIFRPSTLTLGKIVAKPTILFTVGTLRVEWHGIRSAPVKRSHIAGDNMFPLEGEHVYHQTIGFHLFKVEYRFDVLDMRPSS